VPDYNVRDQPSFDRYAVVGHGLSDEQCISSWTSSGSIQVPALETICTARFEISLLSYDSLRRGGFEEGVNDG
ncbi:hypothetical protein, partial [Corynebacterium striatum]|uniref:hypothetical protein n=1 Tax=Corynebacterium striatum TaxID=43770 RepID=UPI001CB72E55